MLLLLPDLPAQGKGHVPLLPQWYLAAALGQGFRGRPGVLAAKRFQHVGYSDVATTSIHKASQRQAHGTNKTPQLALFTTDCHG